MIEVIGTLISTEEDKNGYKLTNEDISNIYTKLKEVQLNYDIEHSRNWLNGISYELENHDNEIIINTVRINNPIVEQMILNGDIKGISLSYKADSCAIVNNSLDYEDILCLDCLKPVSVAFTKKPKNGLGIIII